MKKNKPGLETDQNTDKDLTNKAQPLNKGEQNIIGHYYNRTTGFTNTLLSSRRWEKKNQLKNQLRKTSSNSENPRTNTRNKYTYNPKIVSPLSLNIALGPWTELRGQVSMVRAIKAHQCPQDPDRRLPSQPRVPLPYKSVGLGGGLLLETLGKYVGCLFGLEWTG